MYTSVYSVHALRNIDSNKGGCVVFSSESSGRGGVGGPSRVGLHACTRHWGGKYDTADWLDAQLLQMDRVPQIGLTKELSAGGNANITETRARVAPSSPVLRPTN